MSRGQRHGAAQLFVGVELGRSRPRVGRERDKAFATVSHQQLRSAVRVLSAAFRNSTSPDSRYLVTTGLSTSEANTVPVIRSVEDARYVERGVARALGAQPAKRPQPGQACFLGLLSKRRRRKCAGACGDADWSTRRQVERAPRREVWRGRRTRSAGQRAR